MIRGGVREALGWVSAAAIGVIVAAQVTQTARAEMLFRDGDSHYYLNKTPCRLRDIQRLFMGTGIGTTSYSVMAQGQIDAILSSRPEDRRAIFEEASGITRFRADRKEAMRKLNDYARKVARERGESVQMTIATAPGKAAKAAQAAHQLQVSEKVGDGVVNRSTLTDARIPANVQRVSIEANNPAKISV